MRERIPCIMSHVAPSIQGSLLKVVLEDYMRLKKLFAERMVHKATTASQGDQSSVTEVESVCAWTSKKRLAVPSGMECLFLCF